MCCGKEFHQLGSGQGLGSSGHRYSVLDKLKEMSEWKSNYIMRQDDTKIYLLDGDQIVGEVDREELGIGNTYYPSGKDYLSLSEAMGIAQSDRSGGVVITYTPKRKHYSSRGEERGDSRTFGTFSGNNFGRDSSSNYRATLSFDNARGSLMDKIRNAKRSLGNIQVQQR